jgi:cold shock CspA family protein
MATGILKIYNPHEGYGVVQADDGQELFMSAATLTNAGLTNIKEGARVEFGIDPRGGGAGLQGAAVNVTLEEVQS